MCGRYVATAPTGVLFQQFAVDEVRAPAPDPSWNVAPTDPVPAVVERRERRLLGTFSWGLVPGWATGTKDAARRINARAETVFETPAFRAAIRRRRCLLPSEGFYEWERRDDGTKQAWFIRRRDGGLLAMAGIWEVWRRDAGASSDDAGSADDGLVRTCAIVTTTANSMMAPIHNRMPVMIGADDWDAWLDPSMQDTAVLDALLTPASDELLERVPVGSLVNNVRNNGPELVTPSGR
jgi:putative SOS response-associated peptidase YedK